MALRRRTAPFWEERVEKRRGKAAELWVLAEASGGGMGIGGPLVVVVVVGKYSSDIGLWLEGVFGWRENEWSVV